MPRGFENKIEEQAVQGIIGWEPGYQPQVENLKAEIAQLSARILRDAERLAFYQQELTRLQTETKE